MLGTAPLGTRPLAGGDFGLVNYEDHLSITIDGVAVDMNLYVHGSLNIVDRVGDSNRASLKFDDKDQTFFPEFGEQIEVRRWGGLLFRGLISEARYRQNVAGNYNAIAIQCRDFGWLAERHVVSAAYKTEGQTLRDIVLDLVNVQADGLLATDGVTTGNVAEGPVIEYASWDYKSHKAAFDELAKLTGYLWWIDYDKKLHFVDRATYKAPISFGSGGDWYQTRKIEVNRDGDDYRNVQYVIGAKQLADPRSENLKGDGTTRSFTLALEIGNEEDDLPTVTVNSVPQTVAVRSGENEDTAKWLYRIGDDTISQSSDETPIQSTDTVVVTYKGLFPIRLVNDDDGKIALRQAAEGGSGRYAHVEKDNKLIDIDAAYLRSEELLRRNGIIPRIVQIETFYTGLAAGQIVSIEDPTLQLSGDFTIDELTIQDYGGQAVLYTIRAVDGDPLGGWADIFQRIIDKSDPITIGSNDSIVVARRREEIIRIIDSLAIDDAPASLPDPDTDAYSRARMGDDGAGIWAFRIGFARIGSHPLRGVSL